MQLLVYYLLRLVILLVSWMPFRLLYVLSDLTYYLLYYLIRYRRKVVFSNLGNSFPEKSPLEIKNLAKSFYHYLADLFFESLKGMSLDIKELEKRHKYINPEIINKLSAEKRSVIAVTAHYGNWEWGAFSGAIQFLGKMVTFYKPINNRFVNKYFEQHRERFNCKMISMMDTFYTFKHYKNDVVNYFMVADQSPSNLKRSYWVDFLNQDTPCIHGPENYARIYDFPVVFIEIRRVKRGFYELYFSLLTDTPSKLPEGELTRLYMEKLEAVIKRDPVYWLWSHRRWKRKRSDIRQRKSKSAAS